MASKHFEVEATTGDVNPFDRQELISWWKQERLRTAKVLVIGAGAIGNETLKNLALLGIGYILVVDFDTISVSNLSRTLLFRRDDVGGNKAAVAAQHLRDYCLESTASVDWLHCDVVWDLGTGVFGGVDVVLGCVDNVEARLAINRHCWLSGTPWIDAGIRELAGHVAVYEPPETPCYLCAATKAQLLKTRERYSCDDFKRKAYSQQRAATVQLSSAIAAAIQTQEAVKVICDKPSAAGHRIVFQGTTNDFDVITLERKPDCPAHVTYATIRKLPLSRTCRLREFLLAVSKWHGLGEEVTLDIGKDFSFVESARCRCCNEILPINAPAFRVYDSDILCASCKVKRMQPAHEAVERTVRTLFSLSTTPSELLELTLAEIGIPLLAVVAVHIVNEGIAYCQLEGDAAQVFPSLHHKDQSQLQT
jgi:molybdopterin/thiamine biosynthesis adenylyltransferase